MIKTIYKKYKRIIHYLFFGVCTTLVNVIVYYVLSHCFGVSIIPGTISAWFAAVLFAYLTNRKWVFDSSAQKTGEIIREVFSFFSCRLFTGLVDIACMWIFVDWIGFDDVIIKLADNLIVIILNYIASKVFVFRKR